MSPKLTLRVKGIINRLTFFVLLDRVKLYASVTLFTLSLYLLLEGAIHATVSIRVLNKTLEEYWFLMKFNLSQVAGNVDIGDFNIRTTYFLVRLQLNSRLIL